ncbi:hypothetical protein Bca52824_058336 [Brassica carinata]|uniref:Uncharacterized protein n=1 Tax=Brassica carinata TaxID=52824 RepID=A0A8X7UH27_BRACI|nr:hypothetical protein Bca52824_058336 [Brassica carinata]
MDITEQLDDGLMDSEMQDDDLMGVELVEMEAKSRQGREVRGSDQKSQRKINLRFFFEDLHRRDQRVMVRLMYFVSLVGLEA